MEWPKIERRLLRASKEALQSFASEYSHVSFYGFIFDCNADYGEVLLCLNSEQDLAERAKHSYPNYSQEEIERSLRWNAGDWAYHGFNVEARFARKWEKQWAATQERIQSAYFEDEDDEVSELFLQSVCRVLIAMERSGAFNCVSRTPGFKALVRDHDEALDDAWERLDQIRASGLNGRVDR
jgi:hypothetical protein